MLSNIRNWGNSGGTLLPAGLLAKAGLQIGDPIEVDEKNGVISIRAAEPKYTLAELLASSPAESVSLSQEDTEWLNEAPVGREVTK
ncbi:AbrB/MazE/SpoVT family DNA-binding domain-containing protein [Echinimonas agarilytica]|uniref:SpoVT-AbrB domain-containing protein n=1 Tax=Echinimonas agarilytica TaxID=1215918 RepID=A0AA41W4G9_9GAMM|nr:AbrB/MazE/SpoVT family DNA-binding domain-containing protein [Echinimonas agarilytica]MCM2678558.1 hypothetical protein [Echinimonas agarilytica]